MPPNYIAFRYGGQLRSINHVDDYVIATEMSDVLPVPPTLWDPHFVLTLGPAIRPALDFCIEVRLRESTGAGWWSRTWPALPRSARARRQQRRYETLLHPSGRPLWRSSSSAPIAPDVNPPVLP
jgi:hypothetical protein